MRAHYLIFIIIYVVCARVNAQTTHELPLPKVPSELTEIKDRADYVIAHFWDGMDFSDSTLVADNDFMEQNFVNYINLFDHTDKAKLPGRMREMLKMAEVNAAAFAAVMRLADIYLTRKDSPMRNEAYHILFLRYAVDSKVIDAAQRERYRFILEMEEKNLPGTAAPDFTFVMRDGSESPLSALKGETPLLLMFFDPECGHCIDTIELLKSSPLQRVRVAAIYPVPDEEMWNAAKEMLPESWISGYSTSALLDEEIYVGEDMPVMYLLDGDMKIILKDATLAELEQYLKK